MHVLSVDGVGKSFEGRTLFSGVRFGVSTSDRMGIVGPNGSGKSTLLRLLAGVETPDDGSVVVNREARISLLSQDPKVEPDATVLSAVLDPDAPGPSAFREHVAAAEAVGAAPDDPVAADRLAHASARVDALDAWNVEVAARAAIDRLGLDDPDAPVGALSGGQRRRVALARALVTPSDLLALDEPTNHLDADTVDWLEQELRRWTRGLVMVTHDRYFLERCVDTMLEIADHAVHRHEGTYATVVEARLARAEVAAKRERTRRNTLRKELEWLRRAPKARGTKASFRVEQAHALEASGPAAEREGLEIGTGRRRLGDLAIEAVGAGKSYGDHTVLRDVDLLLGPGDRIGIVGPNGAGKTTLLELLSKKLETETGTVRRGPTVELGFYAQETTVAPSGQRVLDAITEVAEQVTLANGRQISASHLAERFLFDAGMQGRAVSLLSGGERRRLALCRVLMLAPNVLVLDEPTNDLDIETLEVLEDWLDGFTGVLLVASHDRFLLDRLVDVLYAVEPGGSIRKYPGEWAAYRAAREEERRAASEAEAIRRRAKRSGLDGAGSSSGANGHGGGRLSYRERRELSDLDSRISDLTLRRDELTAALNDAGGNHSVMAEVSAGLEAVLADLESAEERWLELSVRDEQGRSG